MFAAPWQNLKVELIRIDRKKERSPYAENNGLVSPA